MSLFALSGTVLTERLYWIRLDYRFSGCVMPQPHRPASSSPPPPPPSHYCQTCGKPMRLVLVEPYPRYTNIDLHNYVCDCGRSDGFFVARQD